MQSQEILDYLLRLSQGKAQLIQKLFTLTEEQSKALDSDEMNKLEKLLKQKQETINKVDLLDREFIEKYSVLKELLGTDSLESLKNSNIVGIKELQQEIEKIVSITDKMKSLDEKNTGKIKASIGKTKDRIKSIKTGKKAVAGYNTQYKEIPSIYIDKKK